MLSDEIDRLEGRLEALQMVVLNSIITLGEHDTDFVPRLLEQLPSRWPPAPRLHHQNTRGEDSAV